MALVSAHRGGAGSQRSAQNTIAAFEAAIALGCDFVEFDVRLTADGIPVIFHDATFDDGTIRRLIAGHRFDDFSSSLTHLDDVLAVLAGRVKAHVDLKVPGHEIELAQRIIEVLGVDGAVFTTAEDSSVRRLIAWSKTQAPGLLVGLSSSRRTWRGHRLARRIVAIEASFPRTRIRLSRANLVVAHKSLAKLSLKRYARRRGLPLLVWTVDKPAELERWINDPDVWMVTTNYPERALAVRKDLNLG